MRFLYTNNHRVRETQKLSDIYALIKLFFMATIAIFFLIADQMNAESYTAYQAPAIQSSENQVVENATFCTDELAEIISEETFRNE